MATRQLSSSSSSSEDDDAAMIEHILQSMGIKSSQYNESVVLALSEYARRFAAELICDAKDYSVHANKDEIEPSDVKLAINLAETRIVGVDPRQQLVYKLANDVNSRDLLTLLDKNNVLIRYPREIQNSLLQRTYTYIPGTEAYPDSVVSNTDNSVQMDTDSRVDDNTIGNSSSNATGDASNSSRFQAFEIKRK